VIDDRAASFPISALIQRHSDSLFSWSLQSRDANVHALLYLYSRSRSKVLNQARRIGC
jgi:hypothetical protein